MVYPHNKMDDNWSGKKKSRKKKKKKQETVELELPDPLVTYIRAKYPNKWDGFKKYATDLTRFCDGVASRWR